MIKDVLQSIANVEIFAIISLLLIFLSFLAILVYILRISKEDLSRYSRLPLDESDMPKIVTVPIDNQDRRTGE